MGRFSRAELQEAVDRHCRLLDEASESGDWTRIPQQFIEGMQLIDHGLGRIKGRDAFQTWGDELMAPYPHIWYHREWVLIDEENDAIVMCLRNAMKHPTEPGVEFSCTNVTRLVYAGDGLFASEEDWYNPAEAARMIEDWRTAGGQLVVEPTIPIV